MDHVSNKISIIIIILIIFNTIILIDNGFIFYSIQFYFYSIFIGIYLINDSNGEEYNINDLKTSSLVK